MGKVYTLCGSIRPKTLGIDASLPLPLIMDNSAIMAFSNADKAEVGKRKFLAYCLYEIIDYIKTTDKVYKYTDDGDSFEVWYASPCYFEKNGHYEYGLSVSTNIMAAELNDEWDGYSGVFDEGE